MNKYYYKVLKVLVKNQGITISDLYIKSNLINHKECFYIPSNYYDLLYDMKSKKYINLFPPEEINIKNKGYFFYKTYHSNNFKYLFKEFYFQIILIILSAVLSAGLTLLVQYLLQK